MTNLSRIDKIFSAFSKQIENIDHRINSIEKDIQDIKNNIDNLDFLKNPVEKLSFKRPGWDDLHIVGCDQGLGLTVGKNYIPENDHHLIRWDEDSFLLSEKYLALRLYDFHDESKGIKYLYNFNWFDDPIKITKYEQESGNKYLFTLTENGDLIVYGKVYSEETSNFPDYPKRKELATKEYVDQKIAELNTEK